MDTPKRMPRRSTFAIAVVATLAFAGIASASASATEWVQGTTTMKWSAPSVTLKKGGGSPVTCTLGTISGDPKKHPFTYGAINKFGTAMGGVNNGGALLGYATRLSCENKTVLDICLCVNAEEGELSPGVFTMYLDNTWPGSISPYGSYVAEWAEGTFKNGSGGSASTLTFENDVFGYLSAAPHSPITISGSIQVTTGTGGLLTLKG